MLKTGRYVSHGGTESAEGGMRSRTVDLAAVADIDDQDKQAIVDDLVDDAVVESGQGGNRRPES